MKNTNRAVKPALAISVTIVAVLGGGIGTAAALAPGILSPATVSGGAIGPTPVPAGSFPKNASGATYGSLLESNSPSNDPDLIKVLATNGQVGYVYKSALAAADGDDAAATFKSPADALKYQAAHANDAPATIPVYASDGTTQIGVFSLG